ncbi:hypothetical protein B0H14DRAFT_2710213 [Mycena olivaceomarginata]|nr:hypothetical protein B0H14DRAFT_2710213 [Mycena olivaceomarginata]
MAFSFICPEPPTSPPLAHLLETNAPLTSMEIHLATSYIDELESQIALLDESIKSLQLRRADLLKSMETPKAILAPVRRLPSEILGEIFSLMVRPMFLPAKTENAPWLFTRVCRRWSAVALATPALWSRVTLELDPDVTEGSLSLTNLCFQRSEQEDGVCNSHPLLDVVLSSSERWRTAVLYINFPLIQQITSIHGNLSSLTTLLISFQLRTDQGFDEEFMNVFSIAPRLRSLQAILWKDVGHFLRAPFSLPWHQLTRLSTTFASNIEALAAFRKLSDIVECTFAFSKTEILPADCSTIRLPHLRSLALQIDLETEGSVEMNPNHTSLLDFLYTPSLRTLTTHDTADEQAILGLITRSDCAASLTSLRFYSIPINESMALHLLKKMPHLTSLDFGDFQGTLLPVSSVPAFIQTFSKQWLRTAQDDHSPRSLRVTIADQDLNPQDEKKINFMLAPMHKDGLFVTVTPTPNFPEIFTDDF